MKLLLHLIILLSLNHTLYSTPSLIPKKNKITTISIQGTFDDYLGGIAGAGTSIIFQKFGKCKIATTGCVLPYKYHNASYIVIPKNVKIKSTNKLKSKLNFLFSHEIVSCLIKVNDKGKTSLYALAKQDKVSYLIPLDDLDINEKLPTPKDLLRTSYEYKEKPLEN